jgi:L-fucose isomerase-like protein
MLAQKFGGPTMFVGAAEESGANLIEGRGDAYCGMLSVLYNAGLRNLRPYIPACPVGMPVEVANMIADFVPIARVLAGLRGLKIFTFGPRPHDFLACNAPIKPLYDLGVEVMVSSELDMLRLFESVKDDPAISGIVAEMAAELGEGNTYPDLLPRLAQFELALLRFLEQNLGASQFGIFANKCWPAFEGFFGFVPCYVNSRLAARGFPVACEVDIYGALSEYMCYLATGLPPTILDINDTVPMDMIVANQSAVGEYKPSDLFLGFHCGNTSASCLKSGCAMCYQRIMHRLMEPGQPPNITRGTLEGQIKPCNVTLFRLQSTASTELRAYVAQGEVLDICLRSFGGIGVFAVPGMGRFYRQVLLGRRFPHHTAVAFAHAGRILFSAAQMLGMENIGFNQPAGMLYPDENPF